MAVSFQKSDVKNAIKDSGGIISTIASRLRCDWHTAKKYIKEFDLQQEYDNETESVIDLAESMLIENIKEQDNTAIIFYLKTKGKNRGYVERRENVELEPSQIIVQSPEAAKNIESLKDQFENE